MTDRWHDCNLLEYDENWPWPTTFGNYTVDSKLMEPIWELIRPDGKVVPDNLQPIQAATAFWKKVVIEVIELLRDVLLALSQPWLRYLVRAAYRHKLPPETTRVPASVQLYVL